MEQSLGARESVFDTNVVVAGLRSRRGASYQLLKLVAAGGGQDLHIRSSGFGIREEVLRRPGIVPGMAPADIEQFLDYLFRIATLVKSVAPLRPSLPDRDDESILELAAQCGATIVTHNIRDFAGAERIGVTVLTPGEFLELQGGNRA